MHPDYDPLGQRLTSAIRESSAAKSDTRAPKSLRRAIAKRRGIFSGAIGLAAATTVAAVAVVGSGLAGPTEPLTPSPTPDLAVEGSRDYAVVSLPTERQMYGDLAHDFQGLCGNPVPEATPLPEDFTVETVLPGPLDLKRHDMQDSDGVPEYSITLGYQGADALPAFVHGPVALFVQDGTVSGLSFSYRPPPVTTFTAGQQRTSPWRWEGWVEGCEGNGSAPAGEYDVVFMTTVYNDLDSAALWSLHMDGYTLPSASHIAALREGSYICQQWMNWANALPLTCAPNSVVGFEMFEESVTAKIPYDTSFYSRDVDITFVSEPLPATLDESPSEIEMDHPLQYEPGTVPACGDVFGHHGGPLEGRWPSWQTPRTPGDTLVASLWPWEMGWDHVTVEVPLNPRVWVSRATQIEHTWEDGDSTHTVSTSGVEVIGWIDTDTAGQSAVNISSYDGPTHWPLTVTDFGWCDGFDSSQDGSALSAPGYTGFIASPTTLEYDDGTTEESSWLTLYPNLSPFD